MGSIIGEDFALSIQKGCYDEKDDFNREICIVSNGGIFWNCTKQRISFSFSNGDEIVCNDKSLS